MKPEKMKKKLYPLKFKLAITYCQCNFTALTASD